MSVLSKEQVADKRMELYSHRDVRDLCDSHEQLRAEVERLTAHLETIERLCKNEAEETYSPGGIQAALALGGSNRPLERIRAERDAALAEVERLVGRIAYEAEQYRDYQRECGRSVNDWGPHDAALREICDAYRAAQPKGGSDA